MRTRVSFSLVEQMARGLLNQSESVVKQNQKQTQITCSLDTLLNRSSVLRRFVLSGTPFKKRCPTLRRLSHLSSVFNFMALRSVSGKEREGGSHKKFSMDREEYAKRETLYFDDLNKLLLFLSYHYRPDPLVFFKCLLINNK